GAPVGAPLSHASVYAVAFSPDGQRVLTSAYDQTARIWRVLRDPGRGDTVESWADLLEVAGGYRVSELSSVVSLEEPERLQRVRRLVGSSAPAFVPADVLLRGLLNTLR